LGSVVVSTLLGKESSELYRADMVNRSLYGKPE
jgi:hypothetical protein